MPAEDWKYIENQFLVATDGSFRRMNIILSDHIAKLDTAIGTDFTLQPLRADITPAYTDWNTRYNAWQNARASYRSLTETFEGLLTQLRVAPQSPGARSLIDYWETKVRAVAALGHPDYTYLFPRGRDPFTLDTRDATVNNVLNLSLRLAARRDEIQSPASVPTAPAELVDRYNTYVALAPQVAAFYTALKNARDAQQGAEGTVDQLRVPLEAARVNAADELYGNLGGLMKKYRKNRAQAAGFFDLDTLRQTGAEEDEPAVPPTSPPPPVP